MKNIIKYLIEFLIVAFGVFLGMYVSEYQNQKKAQANKEKSLKFIIDELESNRERLKKTVHYHQAIKESFDSISATLSQKDLEKRYYTSTKFKHTQIKGWTGVGLVGYDDVAYESAKLSGAIQEMDVELINTISKVYKAQASTVEYSKSVLDQMIAINSSTKTIDVTGMLQFLTRDVLYNEKQVLLLLDVALKKIRLYDLEN